MPLPLPDKRAWIIPFVIAGLSMLGTVYTSITHNDKDLSSRVTALEAHREDDSQKLDHIQQQLDRLVTSVLGK